MEVANKLPNFRPPKLVQHLLQDGQHLPIFFTEPGDTVLVTETPSTNYKKALTAFGFSGNEFYSLTKIRNSRNETITAAPWGWSPTEATNFKTWFPANQNNFEWKPAFQHWYRRETAANVVKQLIQTSNQFDVGLVPVSCQTVEEVENFLDDWGSLVMKAPLSSSGRGVQFLRKKPLNNSNKQWIQGVIDQQVSVMVERLLDKIFDFSYHFYKHSNGQVDFVGETAFVTNTNGKYRGNFIGPIIETPAYPNDFKGDLKHTQNILQEALQSNSTYSDYSGFLGVDMLFYKDGNQIKLHPCVEINARRSMGLLAIYLQKWIKRGVNAQFIVEAKSDVREEDFHLQKEASKISTCYWPLNDFWKSQKFVFMLKVE